VCVNDMVLLPTAQANSYLVHRHGWFWLYQKVLYLWVLYQKVENGNTLYIWQHS
jgi:hypothetical protein